MMLLCIFLDGSFSEPGQIWDLYQKLFNGTNEFTVLPRQYDRGKQSSMHLRAHKPLYSHLVERRPTVQMKWPWRSYTTKLQNNVLNNEQYF